ncbi:hypothetical protein BJ138DRAFT_1137935 [Hygrophoropsis aurantiaca]|uniref:Uncharacterized protein n=1 Tax=Hygrophoropsis aurantiaca TaxID=72124 RepID=A0ACB8A0H2_9AGAM|nr:hypothetical protein BJ138DRAFT_1137935 [Hygrophoropsis aurantiaca]
MARLPAAFPLPRYPVTPNTHTRSFSLPPLTSDGPDRSDPIIGDKETQKAIRREKAQLKRANTLTAKKANALEQEEAQRAQALASAQRAAAARSVALDRTLQTLTDSGLSIADLMEYVFNPSFKQGVHRWNGFFKMRGTASGILDHWVSKKNSRSARAEVHDWAVSHIQRTVRSEARTITKLGFLRSRDRPIDAHFFLSFDLTKIYDRLREVAGVATSIFKAFSTPPRHLKDPNTVPLASQVKQQVVVSSMTLQSLGQYSRSNSWYRKVMALYFYATGAQRQTISVASHIGLSESYSSILWRPGTLRALSDSMRDMARTIAENGLFGVVYDNINMMLRVGEQVIGRNNTQENGTCATIWPLWKAREKDLQVVGFTNSFNTAAPLSAQDIVLSSIESSLFRDCLIHTILRIIVDHGGPKFKTFHKDLERTQPSTEDKIELHKTELHPLPAMHIDESTIVGNGEVVEAVLEELRVKDTGKHANLAKVFAGDQLSIARLRTLANIRAGQEGGFAGFGWGIWLPGLFHAKIADMHGFFVTHWGKPNAGNRNPGSLSFHNTRLHRNPITLTSLPPFQTCRDIVFVSLYARVLHCLLLVSKKASLKDYTSSVDSWETLKDHATDVYTDAEVVSDLRWKRRKARMKDPNAKAGDMVYENAVLYLRDALISREFTDAVKAGDSGRVVLVLKVWALSYRGSGRTKYAHEMLHLIHNLTHVWPKPVRSIVLNNWLLNPSGKRNSFVEVDLVQEHMNYWIKNIYKAHGSAASWEWLEMVSPCVMVLRHFANNMHSLLGSNLGTMHEPLDLSRDIPVLMSSLDDHGVYTVKNGRILDDDDPPQLTDSSTNPLVDYNQAFMRLQGRRRLTPVVGGLSTPSTAVSTTPISDARVEALDDVEDNNPLAEDGDSESEPEDFTFEGDEPTLTRESAEDVSLDMDAEDLKSYDHGEEEGSEGDEDFDSSESGLSDDELGQDTESEGTVSDLE